MDIARYDLGSAAAASATGLSDSDLDADPVKQFGRWFSDVLDANVPEPNAMTVATVGADGAPSARIVLLKAVDHEGFVFFTNYESQKGRELERNAKVALVFFWPALQRQVRVVGVASKTSREESEDYFHSRPVGSQLGAWASQQSQVLPHREDLDRRVEQLTQQYLGKPIPLPPYWGGFRVQPAQIEFWQARLSRLHDRFRYRRDRPDAAWVRERLSP